MLRAARSLQGWTISCTPVCFSVKLVRTEAHAGQAWPTLRATELHVGVKFLTKAAAELLHQVKEIFSHRITGRSGNVPKVFPLGVFHPTPTVLLSNIVKQLPNSLFSIEAGRVEKRFTADLLRWQMSFLIHLLSPPATSALSQAFGILHAWLVGILMIF